MATNIGEISEKTEKMKKSGMRWRRAESARFANSAGGTIIFR